MTSNNSSMNNTDASILFERVVSIIEEGRKNTVRAINFNIVLSYCLIGREIVEEIQEGKVRAEYGKQILEDLSQKLNLQYGKGFSVANLRLFRQFYLTYSERMINYLRPNTYIERENPRCALIDSDYMFTKHILEQKSPSDDLATQHIIDTIRYPMGSELNTGFNPQLSWSHYRALIRVKKDDNPTIGLILCTDKNDAVAKYSVISERKQIFASKYMLYLPTEEELTKELLRERRMIEERLEENDGLVGKI